MFFDFVKIFFTLFFSLFFSFHRLSITRVEIEVPNEISRKRVVIRGEIKCISVFSVRFKSEELGRVESSAPLRRDSTREREWGERVVLSRRLFMANFKPLSVAAVIINKRHYAAAENEPSSASPLFLPLSLSLSRVFSAKVCLRAALSARLVRSPGEITPGTSRLAALDCPGLIY